MPGKLASKDTDQKLSTQEKNLVATCGLYCGACGIYQATQEDDSERILQYAVVLNQAVEATKCDGCGAQRKSLHCSSMCHFIDCRKQKGVNLCVNCTDFPCWVLIEFQSKMPHRQEIIKSLLRRAEVGLEQWLKEMNDLFTCLECGTLNSAYHFNCRECGNMPGSIFFSKHKDLIEKYMSK